MKLIIEMLKGSLMGIANIIPGLSGGTLAVVMNIYDKLIDAITDVVKHPIKVIKSIWIYIVGIVVGLVAGMFGISYLLETFEVPTTALFIGLIVGAIPLMFKEVDKKKITKTNIIVAVLMGALVISLPYLSLLGSSASASNPIIYFFLGTIAAATMVIPGVSGSMVLMTLGYYDSVVNLGKDTISNLVKFNIPELMSNLYLAIPLGIGIILGVVIIAKAIKWLFKKHKQMATFAILGLIIASPFAVIAEMSFTGVNVITVIVAIITFAIGTYASYYLSKIEG